MVRLGTLISAFVVFTLLILLAPAVVLLPGENVAQGQAVTQEVEANFSFSEGLSGSWGGFNAGSGGIDPTYKLCLEQYTREHMVRPNSLSGCGFRNYTTASGTVSGDLSGSISLAWNTFRFNTAYPYTPTYNDTFTATDFGFMMGRGLIDEGSGNNFTFVFLADFDCDDDDMTNAEGKGFMLSVEENGAYGSDPDPANRHKIIGDFDINKTGANYAGNFHLRDYPPEEVFDLGVVTIQGAVKIDDRDPIGTNLSLVNLTVDTPMYTPTDHPTGFEEINFGKDPTKNVTAGHMGKNGTMDISRNSALYLEYPSPGGQLSAHIEGTNACNLFINDTYGVTGDDGTSHGEVWQFLLLSLPESMTPVTIPSEFGHQQGYTWRTFGMHYPTTESYAGSESFALANISLEASTYHPQQYSDDVSYGLYPHPKVESVTPGSGYPGETLNVVITGKYFLKARPGEPGSSWSLGPGITVNSWSLKDSSPIDNEIQACITIDSGAATTTRDANVTACFNYNNDTNRQYMSGELSSAFTVKPLAAGTLQGSQSFSYIEPFVVTIFDNATHNQVGSPINTLTDTGGTFVISNITAGTYDIGIKSTRAVSEVEFNVTLASTTVVDFGTMRVGDCNGDDYVTISDRTLLYGAWGTQPGDLKWRDNGDFNHDGYITISDRTLLYGKWGHFGDLTVYP
jgi:hypothetical protein